MSYTPFLCLPDVTELQYMQGFCLSVSLARMKVSLNAATAPALTEHWSDSGSTPFRILSDLNMRLCRSLGLAAIAGLRFKVPLAC